MNLNNTSFSVQLGWVNFQLNDKEVTEKENTPYPIYLISKWMKNFIHFWNRSCVFKLSGLGVDEASSATQQAMLKKIIVITIKQHDHVAWFYQIHIAVWIRISVEIYVTVIMNFSGLHKNKLKHYSSKILSCTHMIGLFWPWNRCSACYAFATGLVSYAARAK